MSFVVLSSLLRKCVIFRKLSSESFSSRASEHDRYCQRDSQVRESPLANWTRTGSTAIRTAMPGHSKRCNPIVQTTTFVILLALLLASVVAFDPKKSDGGEAAKSCDEPAMPTNKDEWPELTGKTGEDAKAAILKDDSKLQVDVLPEGSMVTMDYRLDRVRVFVGDDGKVVRAPRKG